MASDLRPLRGLAAVVVTTLVAIAGCYVTVNVAPPGNSGDPSPDAGADAAPPAADGGVDAGGPQAFADPDEAAKAGLPIFLALVTPKSLDEFGFASMDELGRVQLGSPYRVLVLPIDDVTHNPAAEMESLLVDVREFIYPLTVDGKVRSSLVVHGVDGGFRAFAFGGGSRVRLFENARSALVSGGVKAQAPFVVVHVPEFDAFFVGTRDPGALTLSPVENDAALGLSAPSPKGSKGVAPSVVAERLRGHAERMKKVVGGGAAP